MIIFDTETTGLIAPDVTKLSKQPEIIEFAAIKVNDFDFKEISRFEFLCKPACGPLPDKITQITGITDKMLENCKPFSAYYGPLCDFFLGEQTMVAHNVAFDRDMLKFELMRMGAVLQFPWPMHHHCTIERSMHMTGKRLNMGQLYKLSTGKEMKGAHRAMVDAYHLMECMQAHLKKNKVKG